jgi:hypothetical protein
MTLMCSKVLLAALPALALIAGHAHAFAALPTSPPWTCLHRRIGTPPTAPGSSYSLAWQAWLPAGARPAAGGKPRRWRAACVRAAEEGVSGGQREEVEGVEVCFKVGVVKLLHSSHIIPALVFHISLSIILDLLIPFFFLLLLFLSPAVPRSIFLPTPIIPPPSLPSPSPFGSGPW